MHSHFTEPNEKQTLRDVQDRKVYTFSLHKAVLPTGTVPQPEDKSGVAWSLYETAYCFLLSMFFPLCL